MRSPGHIACSPAARSQSNEAPGRETMLRHVATAFVLGSILTACGGESGPHSDSHREAIDNGTGSGSCQLASAGPGICTGQWKFQTLVDPCTHTGPNAAKCGNDQGNPLYPSCANPDFGLQSVYNQNYSPGVPHHYVRVCSKYLDGDCVMWRNQLYVDDTCSDVADNYAAWARAPYPSWYQGWMVAQNVSGVETTG